MKRPSSPLPLILVCALGILPWASPVEARESQAAALSKLPGVRVLGHFAVSDVVRTVDGKEPKSSCAPLLSEKDRSKECGARVWIVETTGKQGKEIAIVRDSGRAGIYESFLVQHGPTLSEALSGRWRPRCQDHVSSAAEVATSLCRTRQVEKDRASPVYAFQRDLREDDYAEVRIQDIVDCQRAEALAIGMVNVLGFMGVSSPSYWVRGLDSERPTIAEERGSTALLYTTLNRTEYQLRNLDPSVRASNLRLARAQEETPSEEIPTSDLSTEE